MVAPRPLVVAPMRLLLAVQSWVAFGTHVARDLLVELLVRRHVANQIRPAQQTVPPPRLLVLLHVRSVLAEQVRMAPRALPPIVVVLADDLRAALLAVVVVLVLVRWHRAQLRCLLLRSAPAAKDVL